LASAILAWLVVLAPVQEGVEAYQPLNGKTVKGSDAAAR
jgi:hypothetical protein